jgi:hypothetical protein
MRFDIELPVFLSKMDEQHFFQVLRELVAIREFKKMDDGLALWIEMRYLNRKATSELIALMVRYGLPLASIGEALSRRKGFVWLKNEELYWYQSMFHDADKANKTTPDKAD